MYSDGQKKQHPCGFSFLMEAKIECWERNSIEVYQTIRFWNSAKEIIEENSFKNTL